MHDKEALQMMNRCKDEIKTLRAQLSVLQPKAEAYDRMCHILDMMPRNSRLLGGTEDVVWIIERESEKLIKSMQDAEMAKAATAEAAEVARRQPVAVVDEP